MPPLSSAFVLPEAVRSRAEAAGPEGREWLSALPGIVERLTLKWQCSPQETLTGGSESLVLGVELHEGGTAVMKIGLPASCDCANEARILDIAGGRGYVTLIDHDAEDNALLLERLGTSLAASGLSLREQMVALCETIGEGWIPLEPDCGLMTGAEKARWLADFIETAWRDLGIEEPIRTRDVALACCEERIGAHLEETGCLVHGDAHANNVLYTLAPEPRLKMVDPDGLFAEPACDLAPMMRNWNAQLLKSDSMGAGIARCNMLATLTGLDPLPVWQWGMMERVSTGLLMLQIGMERDGRDTLRVANAWANRAIVWNPVP